MKKIFILFSLFCLASCDKDALIPVGTVVNTFVSKTGRIWMDRNLGASQVATSSTDAASYGDLYQWGRGADGHQIRNSGTTNNLSSTDQPGNNLFILPAKAPWDWRSQQNNNLWYGLNGINNPCPSGFRVPTKEEFIAEAAYWGNLNSGESAFNSPLKLPLPGYRAGNGIIYNAGSLGKYWWSRATTATDTSSTVAIGIDGGSGGQVGAGKAFGFSVRCIKD